MTTLRMFNNTEFHDSDQAYHCRALHYMKSSPLANYTAHMDCKESAVMALECVGYNPDDYTFEWFDSDTKEWKQL